MNDGPILAELWLVLPACWSSSRELRRSLAQWLVLARWAIEDAEDLTLAISEAVSNSVEHGYLVTPGQLDHPGTVQVHARIVAINLASRCVQVRVCDQGIWRSDDHSPHGSRGRGLSLMAALMASVRCTSGPDGTVIELRTHQSPNSPAIGCDAGPTHPSQFEPDDVQLRGRSTAL